MQLFSTNDLTGFEVRGNQETLGRLSGFLFNPKTWKLKYLTIIRKDWPNKKELYLPTNLLDTPDNLSKNLVVNISIQEIDDLQPEIMQRIKSKKNPEHPISYWRVGEFPKAIPWLDPFAISAVFKQHEKEKVASSSYSEKDLKLRKSDKVKGYQVDAMDGVLGKVKDLIIDADNWIIRYIAIESEDEKILLPSAWVLEINPFSEKVRINLSKELILDSPYVLN